MNLTQEQILQNDTYRGYFNSAQALADYAAILTSMKNHLNAHDSPVIVIGASYGGGILIFYHFNHLQPYFHENALIVLARAFMYNKILFCSVGFMV